jgi:hypothetical protein
MIGVFDGVQANYNATTPKASNTSRHTAPVFMSIMYGGTPTDKHRGHHKFTKHKYSVNSVPNLALIQSCRGH